MIRVFDRAPGSAAATYAEAQALVDDGLSVELVLSLFADEADWLRPLLVTGREVRLASQAVAPRYAFQASLRQKFLRAAAERAPSPRPMPLPVAGGGGLRGRVFVASAAAAGAVAAGVLALAVLTDANAPEIETRLRETGQQVQQVGELSSRGQVTEEDLHALEVEIDRFAQAAQAAPLDEAQKARARETLETAVRTLQQVREQKPELDPVVAAAEGKLRDAAQAAGLGSVVEPLETPAVTSSPTATETATASPSATATGEPSATATPTATSSVTPEPTAEPAPSQPVELEPSPTATGTVPAHTPEPTAAP